MNSNWIMDSHLPWSDHDEELFVVDLAVLIFISQREHVKNLLSKVKVFQIIFFKYWFLNEDKNTREIGLHQKGT